MDFSSLLKQVSSLEEETKAEAQRYLAEVEAHRITKTRLSKAEESLEKNKKSTAQVAERLLQMECQKTQQQQQIEQLKVSLNSSHKNLLLVKEHFAREVETMKQQREIFIQKTTALEVEFRSMFALMPQEYKT